MADIELVIKIPEEMYKASTICDALYEDTSFAIIHKVRIIDAKQEDVIQIPLEVIKNGIPLPKGHDDLIERGGVLASFVAARGELSGEFDEGLHEAWEIVNSEDATPAIIKAEGRDS